MTNIVTLVDHLADKDDRWLLLATWVIGLCFAVYLFKWLVGKYSSITEKLASVIAASTAVIEKNCLALDRNSQAFEEVSRAIEHCRRASNPLRHE